MTKKYYVLYNLITWATQGKITHQRKIVTAETPEEAREKVLTATKGKAFNIMVSLVDGE